jgi:ketosteroid isomerase-like protein
MGTPRLDAKRALSRAARGARLLVLVLLAGACRGPRAAEKSALRLAIEAENQRLVDLFRSGDLLGVADLYADDAEIHDATGARTAGREEIDAYWSAIESPVAWRLEARTIRGSETLVYESGTARLTTRQGETLLTSVTDFLLVWQRPPSGAWRIRLHAEWPKGGP